MKQCCILDNKRVKQNQQTATQLNEMRKVCVVPLAKRRENNFENIEALKLANGNNKFLQGSGLALTGTPLQIRARLLLRPHVSYDGYNWVAPKPKTMWSIRTRHQMRPAGLNRWTVYFVSYTFEKYMQRHIRNFVTQLVEKAKGSEMQINPLADYNLIYSGKKQMEKAIVNKRNSQCTFLLFVQSEKACLHEAVK